MKYLFLKWSILLCAFPLHLNIYFACIYQWTLAYLMPLPYSNGTEYDFIVGGAGSAGSTVAGRLIEAGHKVLLIEAGGPSHWMQGIPGMANFFRLTPYDWQYKTIPQENSCFGLKNNVSFWPRGKELGGSSMMNHMVYLRGHSKDFDEWEELGNDGWAWKAVLPLFKKAESHVFTNSIDMKYYQRSETKDHYYHGKNGPLGTQLSPSIGRFGEIFMDAGKELGYKFGDLNGDLENEGFMIPDLTLSNNWRMGTYRSYCEKYAKEGKLDVLTFSHITNIIIENKRAVGLKVNRFGKELEYKAKKEVILSSGAIGSPQILMLSGIGPKDHLSELGIPVTQDLPVGHNLQDHLSSQFHYMTNQSITGTGHGLFNPASWLEMALYNSGNLYDTGIGAIAQYKTELNQDKFQRPDIELNGISGSEATDYGALIASRSNSKREILESYFQNDSVYTGLVQVSLNRPQSRGYIRLKNIDPFEHPIIDPRYLTSEVDVNTMIEGTKFAEKLLNTEAMRDYGIIELPERSSCVDFEQKTDEYYKCLVHHKTRTVFHYSGTCKMGPMKDKSSVVTPDLKVKGVQNLRVIDASIMPLIVGANINAATIMIGEKGAELIINEHGKGSYLKSDLNIKSEL